LIKAVVINKSLILVLLLLPGLLFAEREVCSFTRALNLALSNNLDLKQAEKDLAVSKAQLAEAAADWFVPDLSLSQSYTRLDQETVDRGSGSLYPDNLTGGFSANRVLFAGLRFLNSYRLKKINFDLARSRYADVKRGIFQTISLAYYTTLLNEENERIAGASTANLKSRLEFTAANYDRGILSEYDFIRAKVLYQNSLPGYLKSKNDHTISQLSFCDLIGLHSGTNLELTGDLTDTTNIVLPRRIRSRDDSIFTNNFQLESLDSAILSLQVSKAVILADRLPSVSAGFNYKYDYKKENPLAAERSALWGWTLGLQLTLPLDEWIPVVSRNNNQLKEADLQIAKNRLARVQLFAQLLTQASQLELRLDEAEQNIRSQKEAVSLAAAGREIARQQYRDGTLSQLELSEAENSYDQAKTVYYQALFSRYQSILGLERLFGTMEGVSP